MKPPSSDRRGQKKGKKKKGKKESTKPLKGSEDLKSLRSSSSNPHRKKVCRKTPFPMHEEKKVEVQKKRCGKQD